MGKLADLVKSDPEFRERFKQDPVAAAESAGIELDADDIARLQGTDFADLSDADLINELSAMWGSP